MGGASNYMAGNNEQRKINYTIIEKEFLAAVFKI